MIRSRCKIAVLAETNGQLPAASQNLLRAGTRRPLGKASGGSQYPDRTAAALIVVEVVTIRFR
jgi:hypothetical protein